MDLPLATDKKLDAMRCALLGTSLIEASAGTGKTYAITTLYVRLVLERELAVEEILVVTYTRAATAELRDRIRKRLRRAQRAIDDGCDASDQEMDTLAKQRVANGTQKDDKKRLTEALRSFDRASIFTIHGFCQRVLQDSAFESGADFDTEFLSDQSELVFEIVNDFWAGEMYGAEPALVRLLLSGKPALSLDTLARLARKVTQNPTMPVLPTMDRAAAASDAVEKWSALQSRAAALWSTDRDQIVALLDGNASLKKGSYKDGAASGPWAKAMDQVLAPGQLGIPATFTQFKNFGVSAIAKATRKGCSAPEHEFFEVCDLMLPVAGNLSQLSMGVNLRLVDYARKELVARKQSLAVQSYDDLLFRLSAALEGKGGARLAKVIRERFPGALIDEFQDTDPLQYRIFKTVYGDAKNKTSLFLIGDPKQAIYGFRGADVFAYMEAREDAGEGRQSMATNWRSDPSLIRAVNAVFSHAQDSFIFDAIQFEAVTHSPKAKDRLQGLEDTAALQIEYFEREEGQKVIDKGWANSQIPAITAGAISNLLASGATILRVAEDGTQESAEPVLPGDIAVLVRKNHQATAMQEALRELNVPSVVESDASVFDSEEALELERVLLGIANPSKGRALLAALTTSILGLRGDELSSLRSREDDWESWLIKFRRWNKTWNDFGFIQAFRMLLSEEAVVERLLSSAGGSRRVTNLYHLGELLQAEASESKRAAEGLVRWLHRMRSDEAARSEDASDSSKTRLESDALAVKLVTIHKSKGLEYPIVYLPFLWDGALLSTQDRAAIRFHDPLADNLLRLDIGSEDKAKHQRIAEREALAENLRLLYVALTRAKHRCTLIWGGFKSSEQSALAYLWHQAADADASIEGLAASAEHAKELDDDGRMADLRALCEASRGAISVRRYRAEETRPYDANAGTKTVLQARAAQRTVRALGRFSSFSALVSGERSEGEERDIDRSVDGDVAQSESVEPVNGGESDRPVALSEFARGARIGTMMHEVFENTDFADDEHLSLAAATSDAFARYGVSEDPGDRFLPALQELLQTPLFSKRVPTAPKLCELGRSDRLDELEFLFPVREAGSELRAGAIAAVLRECPDSPWPASYPDEVAKIDFLPLKGFMRGFVDLIFCHEGRWYLADYKSNHLGTNVADYAPASLQSSMASHHYYLQYLVYTVALHRYLGSRMPGYDYEQHMGGVFYLFVRGISRENPKGTGVFGDLPPLSLVSSLSDLFTGDKIAAGEEKQS